MTRIKHSESQNIAEAQAPLEVDTVMAEWERGPDGPINTNPARERDGFGGSVANPGLRMAGRYAAAIRLVCADCGVLVRPVNKTRHIAKHHGAT